MLHLIDELQVPSQMMCGGGAVTHLAEVTVVLAGRIRRDDLALCAAERIWPAQQKLRERTHRRGGFRTERQESCDSRQSFRERNVCHEWFSFNHYGIFAVGTSAKGSRMAGGRETSRPA